MSNRNKSRKKACHRLNSSVLYSHHLIRCPRTCKCLPPSPWFAELEIGYTIDIVLDFLPPSKSFCGHSFSRPFVPHPLRQSPRHFWPYQQLHSRRCCEFVCAYYCSRWRRLYHLLGARLHHRIGWSEGEPGLYCAQIWWRLFPRRLVVSSRHRDNNHHLSGDIWSTNPSHLAPCYAVRYRISNVSIDACVN